MSISSLDPIEDSKTEILDLSVTMTNVSFTIFLLLFQLPVPLLLVFKLKSILKLYGHSLSPSLQVIRSSIYTGPSLLSNPDFYVSKPLDAFVFGSLSYSNESLVTLHS